MRAATWAIAKAHEAPAGGERGTESHGFRAQTSCALWFEPAVQSLQEAGRPSGRRAPEAPRPAGDRGCGCGPQGRGPASEDGARVRVRPRGFGPAEFEPVNSVLHAQATADKTGPVYPVGCERPGEGLACPCPHGDSGMGHVPAGSPNSSDRSWRGKREGAGPRPDPPPTRPHALLAAGLTASGPGSLRPSRPRPRPARHRRVPGPRAAF